ncbi:MAG: phosphoribosyl-ATP diphosphatase [Coriobacteriales bacterium]|jgi:phosphoribosyl-ATP pyrophosphohydrolase|nr:phosphoribosyl-ATP diphosphatase [Coriobacteriales bacterium]
MGERTAGVIDGNLGETLRKLTAVIAARREVPEEESYTARLLANKGDILYKKLVEEACELALAAKDADHDHIRYEAADLLYHLLVLLEREAVTTAELAGELDARAAR